MARLNPNASRRSDRDSSIYEDPTPDRSRRSTTRNSLSPSPSTSSDKENQGERPQRKGKGAMAPPPLPTPVASTQNGTKRRRLGEYNIPAATQQSSIGENGAPDLNFYDPDQDAGERRNLRKEMREHTRELHGKVSDAKLFTTLT